VPDQRGASPGRPPSRRSFLRGAVSLATLAALPAERRLGAAPSGARFSRLGYAAITWQGHDEQAIEDIASLGFHGIQLRATALERWGARPQELRRRLGDKRLSLMCLSSGTVDAEPARRQEYLDAHTKHAAFVKDVGGETLQLLSQRPKDRAPTVEEFTRLGALLTEVGRRAQDLGVRLVYHNHMNGFGEAPDEVARVLEVTDPRFVSLLLDIAHYEQGGGDPVAAVSRHKDRLGMLHLKDVVSPVPGDTRPPRQSYEWVELGRGKVDVPGVMDALRKIEYRGPAIIELDRVTSPEKTARDCAALNKKYAVETLGLRL
jgi:inosose dehydratase